ncbi:Pkinase-domain-containing protein [Lentithecium fluviatile CBS 122367]|uniref:Pkinase-domain-containing protein n=1 Tax=Lentithecium fluviatile CBS 122367 TaxID=1168545 RepID=A0A6G1IFS3_9PLEO|nr:Pkinase-domain-containing protein [Lentithecium fluviatile CBS 122367]
MTSDEGVQVGYLEVKIKGSDPYETPDLIDIFGNEQFYLGRNTSLCRRHWSDPTISNRHLRIHCILYEKDPVSDIPPFVYATDLSTNGTFLKKSNVQCASSQDERGMRLGRSNGSFLLDDGDELRISDNVTLIYHEFNPPLEQRLTYTQEQEKQLFASRYLVTGRLLGIGGFGKVFIGIHQKTQRQLACKVVNLRGLYDGVVAPNLRFPEVDHTQESMITGAKRRWPSKVARCFREFDVLKHLSHPNIISVEKVFWSANSIYIFEDLVTGGDLFSYIEYKGGRLADVEAAVIVRQILIGIEYLHNLGIVHRDLKPDNVLMTSLEDGARVVITDFGNARRLPQDDAANVSHPTSKRRMFSLVGTLEFAAPEIHQRNPAIPSGQGYSKAVDMWSIGSITAALLTGDVIFTDRGHPDYDEDPFEVIMGLAAQCDISALDDESDLVWRTVGPRPKDFIKHLLVLREEDRMTATQALAHPWFSNARHATEFEALYQRSIRDWRPRGQVFRLVEPIRSASPAVGQPELSQHFARTFLRGLPIENRDRRMPSQRQGPNNLSSSPVEHEESRFEGPSCYDQQSYEDGGNDTGRTPASSRLLIPDSFDSSMDQLSPDPDPPASGMYSAYEVQGGYVYDDSSIVDETPVLPPYDVFFNQGH